MRASARSKIVALLSVAVLLLTGTMVWADTVQVDGDIVDANKDLVVAECGELPFEVDVKWSSGFAHFTPGASVTVSATPSAAATAAGVVISGGGPVTIPSPWTSGSVVSSPFTISAPGGTSGTYTVNISATGPSAEDPDGTLVVARQVDLIVNVVGLTAGGFLQPVNPGPPNSIFRYKSTIPVKVTVYDCEGAIPDDAELTISVVRISGSTPTTGENEAASTSAADTGINMRYEGTHYMYNLATRPLSDPTATYQIIVTIVATGETMTAIIGLRN